MMNKKRFISIPVLLLLVVGGCHKVKKPNPVPSETGNWTKVEYDFADPSGSPEPYVYMISSISFADAQNWYMSVTITGHEPSGKIYKSTDAGVSWTRMYAPECCCGNLVDGVEAITPARLAILFECSSNGPMHISEDGAATWNYIPGLYGKGHTKIDAQHIVLGTVKTSNAGLSWEPINPLGQTSDYFFRDTTYGVSATVDGVVAKSIDFGQNWTNLLNDNSCTFNAVCMPDASTIVAGGNKIMRSTDGGVTWNVVSTETDITDIKFVNANVGFATTSTVNTSTYTDYTGKILKTVDGGATWTLNYSSVNMGFSTLGVVTEDQIIAGTSHRHQYGRAYYVMTTTQGN